MALNGTSIFTLLNTALRHKTTPVKNSSGTQRKKRQRQRSAAQEQVVKTQPELLRRQDPVPTTSALKRPAPPETQPNAVQQSKKKRLNRKVTCRVSIVLVGYPDKKLTDDLYKLLTDQLVERMDRISPQFPVPKFHQCYLAWGAAMVTCANEFSKIWLQKIVPLLAMPAGVRLQVAEGVERGPFTRVAVWIPGCACETHVLLRRLGRQNPGFTTHLWKVYSREDIPGKGCRLILGVNSVVTVQTSSFRPFLGLGRVTFKVLDPKPKRTTNGQ